MIDEFIKTQIDNIEEHCKISKPLVVIRCITYNHESYLKDALEGFVMQKTDFPFVAIIHEDASTDGTAEILKEFEEKYPDIIFPIYEKENQYSKSNGSLGKIMNMACDATGAEYVALCEGDDYWIDPLKLQKQLDFLKSNPDYSLVFHKADVISETDTLKTTIYDHLEEREYNIQEILKVWSVPTASVMFRSNIINKIPWHPDFCVGDNIIWATCAENGKIFCLKDNMSIYRRQKNGWIGSTGTYDVKKKMILHDKAMLKIFPNLPLSFLKDKISCNYVKCFIYKLKRGKIDILMLLNGVKYSPLRFIKFIILNPIRKNLRKLKS